MDEDRQMKIWSSVKGTSESARKNLQPLLAAALTEAAVFGALLRRMPGASHPQLRQLREEELSHARCIQGIHMLAGGGILRAGVSEPEMQRPEAALRRSYGKALQMARSYAQRQGDPEYGPVFRRMAEREEAHCVILAELMGILCI